MHKYFFSAILLLLSCLSYGQGWERTYGGGGQDAANALLIAPDGGYLLAGTKNNKLSVLKTDPNGNLQWSKDFSEATSANDALRSSDGNYVIVGTALGNNKIYLCKITPFGTLLWSKTYGNAISQKGFGVVELPSGGYAVVGKRGTPALPNSRFITVTRTDAQGNAQWTTTLGDPKNLDGEAVITLADNGDLIVAGDYIKSANDKDIYLARLNNASGQLIWEHDLGLTAPDNFKGDEIVRDIQLVPDGILIAGSTKTFSPQEEGAIFKIAADGSSILWNKRFPNSSINSLDRAADGHLFIAGVYSFNGLDDVKIWHTNAEAEPIWDATVGKGGFDTGFEVLGTPDGGAICAGTSSPFVNSTELLPYLVKTDANGLIFTSYLKGNVFRDLNQNCLRDAGEMPMKNWLIQVEKDNFVRYAIARNDGSFEVAVDTGNYKIKTATPNDVWETCTPVLEVPVPAFYDTIAFDLSVRSKADCPRNEVSIATPILRRCTENTFTVRYCNSGSVASSGTYIDVELGSLLSLTSSSITGVNQGANVWRFNIGNIPQGECGSFFITAFLNCTESVAGQAQCVKAHIYPDSFCVPVSGWSGAIVEARAFCAGDSVKMVLKNVGTAKMNVALDYVIGVDVVMLTGPSPNENFQFLLEANEADTVWTKQANGQTYRIIAKQEPGYPGMGFPTAAVEGCKADTSTQPISYGYYTMFPEDDANPTVSFDCQEIFEADYNPIYLKRGHPKGYDVAHYISPETDLDYLIQFRNTGTSTVQQVIVRDTLSSVLDPTSLRPGAASHPYEVDVYGEGIVEFKMTNMNLPPGSSSEGFVRFRVSPKDSLPCGTVIFNKAAITFDFNQPFITAETFHTVCPNDSSWVISDTRELFWQGADLKVYPMPVNDVATVEVTGVEANNFAFYLYNTQGQLIFNQIYSNSTFQLYRNQIPAGQYVYHLVADGKAVATGKMIIH